MMTQSTWVGVASSSLSWQHRDVRPFCSELVPAVVEGPTGDVLLVALRLLPAVF